MPAEEKKGSYTVEEYADFLSALAVSGLEVLVIGGCAVGAYAALKGDSVFSGDLDLYTTLDTQIQILEWAPGHATRIIQRPQPRALPVAVLEWKGKDINVLTESKSLPQPAEAAGIFWKSNPNSRVG